MALSYSFSICWLAVWNLKPQKECLKNRTHFLELSKLFVIILFPVPRIIGFMLSILHDARTFTLHSLLICGKVDNWFNQFWRNFNLSNHGLGIFLQSVCFVIVICIYITSIQCSHQTWWELQKDTTAIIKLPKTFFSSHHLRWVQIDLLSSATPNRLPDKSCIQW